MRRTPLIVILVMLSFTISHQSRAWSLLGAESLNLKTMGAHFQVGQPGIDASLHIPITKYLEVAPKFGFYFAPTLMGEAVSPGHFGNRFGADLKYLFLKKGRLYVAFFVEPALFINYNPLYAGLQLGIPGGVKLNYELQNRMNVSAGLSVPIGLTFTDPVLFVNPINIFGGLEIPIKKGMNLSFLLETGAVIRAIGNSRTETGLNLRLLAGIGILL